MTQRQHQITLKELAELTQSHLIGDGNCIITNVADLESAEGSDASFLANPRYEKAMQSSRAGVVFIDPSTQPIEGRNYLVHHHPSKAFQQLIDKFYGDKIELTGFENIHSTAIIHPSCTIGINVCIGPYVVIDMHCMIGDNTFIGTGSYIGPRCSIGKDCLIHPHVTIREYTQIGERVILQPGAVIGSCGFGYITDPKTMQHVKLNQVGNVTIEDDVEIGANTTIDRSRFKTTLICKGTKIDNLVQIGHGVKVGQHNIIVAQSGIAGSTETGKYVVIGGQVAVNGHIKIADGVMIAGRSGVTKSITKSGKYGGLPVVPMHEHNRHSVFVKNIESYVQEIKLLKQRLEQLEKGVVA